jgi:hypothetical protein
MVNIMCLKSLLYFRYFSIKWQKLAISEQRKKSHIVPGPCKVCTNFMSDFNPWDIIRERRKRAFKIFEGQEVGS